MENTMTSEIRNNFALQNQEVIDKNITTGAKPKTTIPLRVLDEEVWFSGSELKTDNSSSDEDKGYLQKSATENKIKRGARRKTRSISDSSITKSEKRTQQKIESDKVKGKLATSPEIFHMHSRKYHKVKKSCNLPINQGIKDFDLFCNQADDEKSQMQKIQILEDRIRMAAREYMASRRKTDQLVSDLVNKLGKMEESKDPEWKYFIETTKKWVNFFTTGATAKDIESEMKYPGLYNPDNEKKKIRKGPARKITKHNIFSKNVKQSSRKTNDSALQQRSSLEILMKSIDDKSMESSYYEPYKFTEHEQERITTIDSKLESFKSCTDLDNLDENHDTETNQSLTDSEKMKIYKLPTYSASLSSISSNQDQENCDEEVNYSELDFDSCEEGFETSRHF